MVKPHEPGLLNALGKRAAPRLAPLLAHGAAAQAVRHLETYLAILQGKGSGTGWDLAAEVQVALAAIRRPDAAIIDVGGGRGDWTAAMLASLPLAQVWLLEPSARALYHLAERGLPRTTVIPAAAGDQPGNALLLAPRSEQPIASLHRRRDSYFQQEQFDAQPVQVVTLDQIIAAFHLDVVDFVKIDVEGHELAVLQGARAALAAGRIKALAFEFGSGNLNARTFFHDVWDELQPLGFDLHRICPGGVLLPVAEYYEDLEHFRGVSNYLAMLHTEKS
jgi:FkbM family methyltransferase